MKIPRDLSGQDLIKSLKKLGYEVDRQVGSHIRLTTSLNGTHHITFLIIVQLKLEPYLLY
jgi:predicted RNA binding protein YcfA (HicA-like mRNA interferase family)